MLNNKQLKIEFKLLVASVGFTGSALKSEFITGISKILVSKLANTHINKIMTTKSEGDLIRDGEVVGDDEMLSPKLEGYTLTTKCKWLIDTFKIY